MSEFYMTEPDTSGKVIMHTTHGDLDFELWPKQAPKACRNFVQNCLEGYYNGCIFHRIIKDFMVQTGDPTGTGRLCESIYGEPFPTEKHGRLKFRNRGMVGLANGGKNTNTNGSQFFITLGRQDDLNGVNTIFARVGGDTLYNLIKISEVETNPKTDKPADMEDPPRILTAEVPWNPFDDIEIRQDVLQKNLKKTKLQGDQMRAKEDAEENFGKRKEKSGLGGGRRMGGGAGGDFGGREAVRKVKKKQILSFGNDSDEEGEDDDDDDANTKKRGGGMFANLKEKKKKKKKKGNDGEGGDHEDDDSKEDDLETKRKKALAEMTGGRTASDVKAKKKARGWDDIDDDGSKDEERKKKKRRVHSDSDDSDSDGGGGGGGKNRGGSEKRNNDDPEEAERRKRELMYENLKKSIVGVGKGDDKKDKKEKKRRDDSDSESLDKDGNPRPQKKKKIKGIMNDLLTGYKTKKTLGMAVRKEVVERRGELREEELQKVKDEKYLARMRKFEDRLKSKKEGMKQAKKNANDPNDLNNPNNANTAQNNLLFPNHTVIPSHEVFGQNKTVFSDQDPLETIMKQYGGREEIDENDNADKAIDANEEFGLTGGLNFHVSSDRAFQMAADKELMAEREKEGLSKDVIGVKAEVKMWNDLGKGGGGKGGGKGGKGKGKKGDNRSPRR